MFKIELFIGLLTDGRGRILVAAHFDFHVFLRCPQRSDKVITNASTRDLQLIFSLIELDVT